MIKNTYNLLLEEALKFKKNNDKASTDKRPNPESSTNRSKVDWN